jgi:uncharacterized protein
MLMIPFIIIFVLVLLAVSLLLSIPMTKRHAQKEVRTPAEVGLEYKSVYFPSTDGLTLGGWWIPAEGSPRTVIFLHGFAGSMDPDIKYARTFHEHGFNVLMFDFRAHGRSGGKLSSLGAIEVKDVLGAYDFAKQSSSWSVGLFGFSMGGRAALISAAKYKCFDAVLSDGGPLRLLTAVSADLRRRNLPGWAAPILAGMILFGASLRLGTNLFYNDPVVLAKKIPPTPALLFHGDLDPYTKITDLDQMIYKSKRHIKVWRVPAARHREVDLVAPDEYMQRVMDFFETYMSLEAIARKNS